MANDPSFEPAPKKSHTLLYVLGGIFGALVLFCCLPCGGLVGWGWYTDKQREDAVANQAGTEVTADALASNYSDSTYKDKVVTVTGKVNANNGILGVEVGSGANKVTCMASSTDAVKFQGITAGQEVKIKGWCAGKPAQNVTMVNCKLK